MNETVSVLEHAAVGVRQRKIEILLPLGMYRIGLVEHKTIEAAKRWLETRERWQFSHILKDWNQERERVWQVSPELDCIITSERDRRMKSVAQTREDFIRTISLQGSVSAKYKKLCEQAMLDRIESEKASAGPSPKQFWRYTTCDALQQGIVDAAEAAFNKPTPREWVNARVRAPLKLKVLDILRDDYGHWRDTGTINNPFLEFVEDYWFPEGKIEDSPALQEAASYWVDRICNDVLK